MTSASWLLVLSTVHRAPRRSWSSPARSLPTWVISGHPGLHLEYCCFFGVPKESSVLILDSYRATQQIYLSPFHRCHWKHWHRVSFQDKDHLRPTANSLTGCMYIYIYMCNQHIHVQYLSIYKISKNNNII